MQSKSLGDRLKNLLEFEKPLLELFQKIDDLKKSSAEGNIDMSEEMRKGTGGKNIGYGTIDRALGKAKALLAEFGFTPSSRTRLSIAKDDTDEFDDIIEGRKAQ